MRCHSLEELVANLEKPRKVFMMVKAGQAVDDMIEQLLPLLQTHEVTWHWVKGHAENEKNNRCDEQAVLESRKFKVS